MPEFQEFYDKHHEQVLMLGVDIVGPKTEFDLPEKSPVAAAARSRSLTRR